MGILKKRTVSRISAPVTQAVTRHPFGILEGYAPLSAPQNKLYYALREAVPIIDAAIFKIIRLVGGFKVRNTDEYEDYGYRVRLNNMGTTYLFFAVK